MVISIGRKVKNVLWLHVCILALLADNLKNAMAIDGEAHSLSSLYSSISDLVSPKFLAKLQRSMHILLTLLTLFQC